MEHTTRPLTPAEIKYLKEKIDQKSRSIAVSFSVTLSQIPFILITCLVLLKLPAWVALLIVALTTYSTGRVMWDRYQSTKQLEIDLANAEADAIHFTIDEHHDAREGHVIYLNGNRFFLPETLLYRQTVTSGETAELVYLPVSRLVLRFNQRSILDY